MRRAAVKEHSGAGGFASNALVVEVAAGVVEVVGAPAPPNENVPVEGAAGLDYARNWLGRGFDVAKGRDTLGRGWLPGLERGRLSDLEPLWRRRLPGDWAEVPWRRQFSLQDTLFLLFEGYLRGRVPVVFAADWERVFV
mmetsp:Transcript_9899/g.11579  ORF Transcript_9899/g.11579 Transcript_9899/m.11579 type:complete len:139 (+) Transcript_9899:228-644(+)